MSKTLSVPARELMLDRFGKVTRAWLIAFFEFLERQFGMWVDVPYLAGNFSWTVQAGDQLTFKYCLMGLRLEVALTLRTTVSGAVASVTVAIPAGLIAAKAMTTVVVVDDNGTLVAGKAGVSAGGSTITITRLDGSAFTDLNAVEGMVVLEVQG